MTKIIRKKASLKMLVLLERRQELEEAMGHPLVPRLMERLQDKLDKVNEELRLEMERSDG